MVLNRLGTERERDIETERETDLRIEMDGVWKGLCVGFIELLES